MTVARGGPRVVDDPAELAALFDHDRVCHLYGLADLVEPYWSASTWWRRGEAAVGLIPLPGSEEVAFYAVSPRAPRATTELLVAVHGDLPVGAEGTGPVGMVAALRAVRSIDDAGPHLKMALPADDLRRVDDDPRAPVVELTGDDAEDLADLHASDPGAVFHLPSTIETGAHVGIRDVDGRLVAAAGTHVLDEHHRVAAIGGVITRPDVRGQGLAARTVSALASRLLDRGLTVGLNVAEANQVARRLYDRLGFRTVHRYEEAHLR